MSLTHPFETVGKVWRKMEREAYRAYHASARTHTADHFFNFCVTAHSMRDCFCEAVGAVTKKEKAPYHDVWNREEILVAVREVANLTKHFQLRDPWTGAKKKPQTRGLRQQRSSYVDIYRHKDGRYFVKPSARPDVQVRLSDGDWWPLHDFTGAVLVCWRQFLRNHGYQVRRQTVEELLGSESDVARDLGW
jgi:hypothetical protein